MDLSIVIPAYNEEKRLPETLASVRKFFQDRPLTLEILVVDDGSGDRTATVAKRARVRALTLSHRGKGNAVREGVLAARGDWILVADADNSIAVETFDRVWRERQGAPIVIASRFLEESRLQSMSPVRIIISKLANIGARLLLGLPFADTQAGFKLYRAREAKKIFEKATVAGFGFDLEVLMLAQGFGIKVKEVPVVWRDARRSQLRALRSVVPAAIEFLQIFWNLEQGRYGVLPYENRVAREFIKFSLVGALNVLVDLAVLNGLVRSVGLSPLSAGTISVLVAMVHSFLWNRFWVFRVDAKGGHLAPQFSQFFVVQGIGNGLHWLFFAALYTFLGLHYNLAKILAIAVSVAWNFTGNKWWVFRK